MKKLKKRVETNERWIAALILCVILLALFGCSKQYVCTTEKTTVGHPATSFNRTETSGPYNIIAETEQDARKFEIILTFKIKGDYHETIYIRTNCQIH